MNAHIDEIIDWFKKNSAALRFIKAAGIMLLLFSLFNYSAALGEAAGKFLYLLTH